MRRWSYKTFFFPDDDGNDEMCVPKKKMGEKRKEKLFWCPNNDQSRDLCRWRKADVIDQLVVVVRSFNLPINTNGFESPHYFQGRLFFNQSGRQVHIPVVDILIWFFSKKEKEKERKSTDRFGKAAVMDSLLLRNLSPSMLVEWAAAELDDGPLVVDDWRRIHGKLPKAISTRDSRRPVAARDLELFPEPIPPVKKSKNEIN